MFNPSDLDILKAHLAQTQKRVDWSTVAVFLGLMGEIFVTFLTAKNKKLTEIVLGVAFTLLIAVGVAGEFLYGSRAASQNAGIQTLMEANTARLENEAATTNERAANAEKEAAELYVLTAPRRLTLDQQLEIRKQLNGFSGRRVAVRSYGLDGEGAALGTQTIYVLHAAGIYPINQLASSIVSGGFESGIQIHGPPDEQDLVRALYAALHSTGKLDVTANGPALNGLAGIGGSAGIGGRAAFGGGSNGPAGPTPVGTPVEITIGIKPIQVLLSNTNSPR
jgi:hypothetical protein